MASWKKLTGAVDLSAKSFLKNKKFSREKRTFSWDWHAWNLLFVCSPSLVVGIYLHKVEKRMLEEARMREEIQERTGVGSRGFLMPERKVREEVQGMLSVGSQGLTSGGIREDGTRLMPGSSASERQGGIQGNTSKGVGKSIEEQLRSDINALRRRLDGLENATKSNNDSSSAGVGIDESSEAEEDSDLGSKAESTGKTQDVDAEHTTSEEATPSVEAARSTAVENAKQMASAAGWWVFSTGKRQGERLWQISRDWIGHGADQSMAHSDSNGVEREKVESGGSRQKSRAEIQRDQRLVNEHSKARQSPTADSAGRKGADGHSGTDAAQTKSRSNTEADESQRAGSLDESK